MPTGILEVEGGNGRLIQGLSQYCKATGYEPARNLAAKLKNYLRGPANYYEEEAHFLFSPLEKEFFKKYGVENERFGGHFHAHTLGLLSLPEYALADGDRDTAKFVQSGYGWDDVDRWVRNHFTGAQLRTAVGSIPWKAGNLRKWWRKTKRPRE
jgi:hypothetical protein